MDFTTLTGLDLAIWLRGFQAARAGEQFNERGDDRWVAGFLYWQSEQREHREKREKSECH